MHAWNPTCSGANVGTWFGRSHLIPHILSVGLLFLLALLWTPSTSSHLLSLLLIPSHSPFSSLILRLTHPPAHSTSSSLTLLLTHPATHSSSYSQSMLQLQPQRFQSTSAAESGTGCLPLKRRREHEFPSGVNFELQLLSHAPIGM